MMSGLVDFSFNPIYSFVGSYCPNYLKYGRLAKVVWKSTPCFCGFDLEPLECENPFPDAYDIWEPENLEIII